METPLAFRTLSPKDFGLLTKWHAKPHIIKVYSEKRSAEKVKRRYSEKLANPAMEMFIIFYDERPIGYIQAYSARECGGEGWPEVTDGTWGMDLFIGEEGCLDRGLGPDIIRQFSDSLLNRPQIDRVLADPSLWNERSYKAFCKAGFQKVRQIKNSDGDALLVEKTI